MLRKATGSLSDGNEWNYLRTEMKSNTIFRFHLRIDLSQPKDVQKLLTSNFKSQSLLLRHFCAALLA